MKLDAFKKEIYSYYRLHKRDLPWRATNDPYRILVSEIMLQQTQVARVLAKYREWMDVYTDVHTLAAAPQHDVLLAWQGLGYNRRGLNLHKAAQTVVKHFDGVVPRDKESLLLLPGIGPYTASAVRAFAWNEPDILIETNIRTVFLHHFFKDEDAVHDRQILPLIEETLDRENPREWYWALMDYGSHLKQTIGNANVKSKHYTRQSRFEGSRRHVRSNILKHVLQHKTIEKQKLLEAIPSGEWDTATVIEDLVSEGFIVENKGVLAIE